MTMTIRVRVLLIGWVDRVNVCYQKMYHERVCDTSTSTIMIMTTTASATARQPSTTHIRCGFLPTPTPSRATFGTCVIESVGGMCVREGVIESRGNVCERGCNCKCRRVV